MHLGNPQFLLGLAGVAIPILVYLLTRQRVKQVAFSTLRFFAGAATTMVRRKKALELLLLALRVAACALLAAAFARPFFAEKDPVLAGRLQAPAARIVVADLSGSMNRGDLPAKLRQALQAALQELPAGAVVGLVGFDQSVRVLAAPTRDLAAVREAASTLAPGQGGSDLAAAIRKAGDLLRQVQAPVREIVCLSDLHRSGWERFRGDWSLEPGVKLTVHPLEPEKDSGLAITAADSPQSVVAENAPRAISVRVANATGAEAKEVPVTLTVAGKLVETAKLTVPAHGQAAVRFRHRFTAAGDNPGVVAVAGGDAPQRRFHFNTRLIPRIPILILSNARGEPGAADGIFFLRTALTPSADSPFVAELAKPDAAAVPKIRPAAVVLLADVAAVPPELKAALDELAARGGGLLFLPGAQTRPESFNATFAGLAPAKLRRILTAAAGRQGNAKAVIGKVDFDHPAFELFQRPHYGDFSTLAFDRYWEVTDSQLCRIPVRLDDGRPLLLEKSLAGGGSAMLLACPTDLAWGNLPLRAIFLPTLHQLMRHLALRGERPTAFLAGQTLPPPAPGQTLHDPDDKPLPTAAGQPPVATRAGFYSLVDAQGQTIFRYAVNQDPAEADTATVAPKEISAALQVEGAEAGTLQAESRQPAATGLGPRREIWGWLLAALALLLLAELWVANRTAEQ
ncbi:MAG: VWA domain-containing protein [Lentisphaeria bacterium]|jgi:hypothetical protein